VIADVRALDPSGAEARCIGVGPSDVLETVIGTQRKALACA